MNIKTKRLMSPTWKVSKLRNGPFVAYFSGVNDFFWLFWEGVGGGGGGGGFYFPLVISKDHFDVT